MQLPTTAKKPSKIAPATNQNTLATAFKHLASSTFQKCGVIVIFVLNNEYLYSSRHSIKQK